MTSRPLATADGSVSAGKSIFISVAELRECLLRSEAARPLLLDARVERQYLEGHLPGAYNMPARELNPVENGVRRLVRRAELRRSANWLADA
ncbi:MAG: rhodanese-like domain-containing protein, partial [Trueperaceae bacterium]